MSCGFSNIVSWRSHWKYWELVPDCDFRIFDLEFISNRANCLSIKIYVSVIFICLGFSVILFIYMHVFLLCGIMLCSSSPFWCFHLNSSSSFLTALSSLWDWCRLIYFLTTDGNTSIVYGAKGILLGFDLELIWQTGSHI